VGPEGPRHITPSATKLKQHRYHRRRIDPLGHPQNALPAIRLGLAHSEAHGQHRAPRLARLYAHPIYWLETFVDTSRFASTCYRAANWIEIGAAVGRGHRAPILEPTRPVKKMLRLPRTVWADIAAKLRFNNDALRRWATIVQWLRRRRVFGIRRTLLPDRPRPSTPIPEATGFPLHTAVNAGGTLPS
jgi:Domain of unknown function (DUF4338)